MQNFDDDLQMSISGEVFSYDSSDSDMTWSGGNSRHQSITSASAIVTSGHTYIGKRTSLTPTKTQSLRKAIKNMWQVRLKLT